MYNPHSSLVDCLLDAIVSFREMQAPSLPEIRAHSSGGSFAIDRDKLVMNRTQRTKEAAMVKDLCDGRFVKKWADSKSGGPLK
jgi:hypothetical protein